MCTVFTPIYFVFYLVKSFTGFSVYYSNVHTLLLYCWAHTVVTLQVHCCCHFRLKALMLNSGVVDSMLHFSTAPQLDLSLKITLETKKLLISVRDQLLVSKTIAVVPHGVSFPLLVSRMRQTLLDGCSKDQFHWQVEEISSSYQVGMETSAV